MIVFAEVVVTLILLLQTNYQTQGAETTCPIAVAPQNGNITFEEIVGDNFTSIVAVYTCHPNYILMGNDSITCDETERWSSPAPWCKRRRCSRIWNTDRRWINVTDYSAVGDAVYVGCGLGYEPDSDNILVCTREEVYDKPLPSCVPSNVWCKTKPIDLFFILDYVKNSMMEALVKRTLEQVVNFLDAGEGLLKTTVITMHQGANVEFMGVSGDKESLFKKFTSIRLLHSQPPRPGDNTIIDAYLEMFKIIRNNSDNVENLSSRIAVVLSFFLPHTQSEELKETVWNSRIFYNVHTFFVYAGFWSPSVLTYVPRGQHVTYKEVHDSDLIPESLLHELKKLCPTVLPKRPLCHAANIDLVFVIEVSADQTVMDQASATCVNILNYFSIHTGQTQTSLITFGDTAAVEFYLDDHKDQTSVEETITSLRHDSSRTNSTHLIYALDLMHAAVLVENHGHRTDAVTYVIIVTEHEDLNLPSHPVFDEDVNFFILPVNEAGVNGTDAEMQTESHGFVTLEQKNHIKSVTDICPACDESDGWYQYHDHCFRVYDEDKLISWLKARELCIQKNSILASVFDQEHSKMLEDIIPKKIGGSNTIRDQFFIGLRIQTNLDRNFQDIHKWADGTPFTEPLSTPWSLNRCFVHHGTSGFKAELCGDDVSTLYACMKPINMDKRYETPVLPTPVLWEPDWTLLTSCDNGEVVSLLSKCDVKADCRDGSDEYNCAPQCDQSQYSCVRGGCISMSYFCDGIKDCADNSDESGCVYSCHDDQWLCRSGQCIYRSGRCDMLKDCMDNSDEEDCDTFSRAFKCGDGRHVPITWVNDMTEDCVDDEYWYIPEQLREESNLSPVRDLLLQVWNSTQVPDCYRIPGMFGKAKWGLLADCETVTCSEGFYKCPNSYCIPAFSVCNGVKDCPRGEEENHCGDFTCPGYYRCEGATWCIHPSQICDGLGHCPRGDDERACNLHCPETCDCQGRSLSCKYSTSGSVLTIPDDTRKLTLRGSYIQSSFLNLSSTRFMAELIMTNCSVKSISGMFGGLTNLLVLNISLNNLTRISSSDFTGLKRLVNLDLSRNYDLQYIENGTFAGLGNLKHLDLSRTSLFTLYEYQFYGLTQLNALDLSFSKTRTVKKNAFHDLPALSILDVSNNDIDFYYKGMFDGLSSLQDMYSDGFQICCQGIRPPTVASRNCKSGQAKISSCKDLIGENSLRIMIWVIGITACLGNVVALLYRWTFNKRSMKRGSGILIANMSVADGLTGVYMMIIGGVDLSYRASYVTADYSWRHSALCQSLGFISTLALEASGLLLFIISFDRFLVINYPLGKFKFSSRTSIIAAGLAWITAMTLAGLPLLPSLSSWNPYMRNGMCAVLPLPADDGPGAGYAIILLGAINFALIVATAVCQVLVYRQVNSNNILKAACKSQEKLAKNIHPVVFFTFICWFPVGIMALVASNDVEFNGWVYGWAAGFFLRLTAVLNPILLTLPQILHKRKLSAGKQKNDGSSGTRRPNIADDVIVYTGSPTADMVKSGNFIMLSRLPDTEMEDLVHLISNRVFDLDCSDHCLSPLVRDDVIFIGSERERVRKVCFAVGMMRSKECSGFLEVSSFLLDSLTKGLDSAGADTEDVKIDVTRL